MKFSDYLKSIFKVHEVENGNAVRLLRWRQYAIIEKAKELESKLEAANKKIEKLEADLEMVGSGF